jgi:hypothetical protein
MSAENTVACIPVAHETPETGLGLSTHDPSSVFAVESKFIARGLLQPNTTGTHDPSSTLAVES